MIARNPHPSMLGTTETALGCWVITGDELIVGDVFVFLGETHRVQRLAPYVGDLYDATVARDVYVAGIERAYTVADPSSMFRIVPRTS
jgi:hypothetical protein